MPDSEQITHAALTHVGVRRSHNQDAFAVQIARDLERFRTEGHIFLVADGMGGHAVGEKASAKAVRDVPLTYLKYVREGPVLALRRAFLETNAGIFAVGQENPEFKGMGTTGTALVLRPEGAWVAHVGDSRVYRVRDGHVEQLSFDHSYVWEMARKLGVNPEDLPDIKRNVIIRSLGPDALVEVDIEGPHPVRPGDVYVLCSDGLSNPVRPEEVGSIVGHLPPEEAVQLLIELANLRGGPDNVTVIVAHVPPDETRFMQPPPLPARQSHLSRGMKAWRKRVPWPLTVLFLGLVLAVVFFVMTMEATPGRDLVGFAALLSVFVGMVGLMAHSRRRARDDDDPAERLRVYRRHPCLLDKPMLLKLGELEAHLREFLEERPWTVEWDRYHELHHQAEKALSNEDLAAAFRAHCRAVLLLAQVINQQRHREENFRPKWDTMVEE